MQKLNLPYSLRKALSPYHQEFHAAVGELAGQKMGIVWDYQGVYTRQGGVHINNRDIIISNECIRDEIRKSPTATPEEQAVAEAIEEVVARFEKEGAEIFAPQRDKVVRGSSLNQLLLDLHR